MSKVIKNTQIDRTYKLTLCLDLLHRGKIIKDDLNALKLYLSQEDLEKASLILNKYELKPKGIDKRDTLNSVLAILGMSIKSKNPLEGYTVIAQSQLGLPKYQALLGTYRHLSHIGDALRDLERKPGELHQEFISLYSWGIRLNLDVTPTLSTRIPNHTLTRSVNYSIPNVNDLHLTNHHIKDISTSSSISIKGRSKKKDIVLV